MSNMIPQELILVGDIDLDVLQDELQGYAYEIRVEFEWDTWKGYIARPPRDEIPWSKEELEDIRRLLETCTGVLCVEVSEGKGSLG